MARTLVAPGQDPREAVFRTAASRAYYAAFHESRLLVERLTRAPIGHGRVHQKVIDALKGAEQTRQAGLMLERLRRKREHADYRAEQPFGAKDAEDAVGFADEVMHALPRHADHTERRPFPGVTENSR